ncbi:uncharacterized protein KY384_004548 [Bacidia gigantensis]|uniref:uncharacterized protein n=1 Tax=Bacidia gigantensis TaxID=2732470 RepID=UPI001D039454|nr:uncharacterized protein KY384_004548 [Bacidia gigantensis]KAG8531190.1 hypothetical protein KY384_004548 [Bacidia gigantensis]
MSKPVDDIRWEDWVNFDQDPTDGLASSVESRVATEPLARLPAYRTIISEPEDDIPLDDWINEDQYLTIENASSDATRQSPEHDPELPDYCAGTILSSNQVLSSNNREQASFDCDFESASEDFSLGSLSNSSPPPQELVSLPSCEVAININRQLSALANKSFGLAPNEEMYPECLPNSEIARISTPAENSIVRNEEMQHGLSDSMIKCVVNMSPSSRREFLESIMDHTEHTDTREIHDPTDEDAMELLLNRDSTCRLCRWLCIFESHPADSFEHIMRFVMVGGRAYNIPGPGWMNQASNRDEREYWLRIEGTRWRNRRYKAYHGW